MQTLLVVHFEGELLPNPCHCHLFEWLPLLLLYCKTSELGVGCLGPECKLGWTDGKLSQRCRHVRQFG